MANNSWRWKILKILGLKCALNLIVKVFFPKTLFVCWLWKSKKYSAPLKMYVKVGPNQDSAVLIILCDH